MPVQLSRSSALVRLLAACAALLITVQLVIPPAAAAPARQDDELTVAPLYDEDEAAAEPADETDEAAAEPADETDDGAVGPAHDEAQSEAEPAQDGDDASAEPVQVDEEAVDLPAADDEATAAAPPDDDPVADPFLIHLLDAINERRARNGTRRLSFVPASANAALDRFFTRTVTGLGWPGPCTHDLAEDAFSWDAVMAAGFGGAPRGEVLACPGPEPYWTPDRTAEQWWDSPIHFGVLYADGDSSSIACSAQGVRDGSNEGSKKKRKSSGSPDAASAIICVTFQN